MGPVDLRFRPDARIASGSFPKVGLVVPCHRAVDDGGLGDYRWGLERKRLLLDREIRYSAV